jgi:hypothetical protein
LDDTDTLESRGTGHLAREIAAALAADYPVLGVTRHQLLFDPRVPYTAKNSSAAILLELNGTVALDGLLERVQAVMRDHFKPGSDPGLCVVQRVPRDVTEFGRRAQQHLVTQAEARALAAAYAIPLIGLGGTEDGVIGALAAVGLAASGEDGRYVMVGSSRQLSGLHPVGAVLAVGIAHVQTPEGRPITEGLILADKLRPARRGARPVAFVEWCSEPVSGACPELAEGSHGGYWRPLKLD